MKKLRYRVLFLASWYPNRISPLLGVFVQRKAEAISKLCDVSVIHVTEDRTLKNEYELVISHEKGVLTVIVYFKPSSTPVLKGFIYNLRYFKSYFIGWSAIKSQWGLPDFFHVNVVDRAGYFALLMKWLRGFQYVITEHSTPDIDFLRGGKKATHIPLRFMKALVIRYSRALNVDSKPSLEYLEKAGFKGRFFIIPNVVDIDDEIASKPKIRNTKKILVHISNLIERKNVGDIIRACSQIYDNRRKDFELHIVGEGTNRKNLEQLAVDLGTLNRCIIFREKISDREKHQLLHQAVAHILNSSEEGFSVVTAESICYGTPVIATKSGGPEDFVTRETGVLIERNDPEGLKNAILYMLDNSEKYSADRLREYGKENFSADIIANRTYAMYEQAITHWHAGNSLYPITIQPGWKVLDVGSGHQPNHRANVLLERYLEPTIHRTNQTVPIPPDKEMIVGDALTMPFRNKTFDFVIASHIAEHVDDPVQFCNELQRVAKSGYIETPGPLTEWLMPTASHKWIVTKKGNNIIFKKNPFKTSACHPFFRFFYLNRDGYVNNTLKSNNFILKTFNFLLLKLWNYTPYAYAKLHWKNSFACKLIMK